MLLIDKSDIKIILFYEIRLKYRREHARSLKVPSHAEVTICSLVLQEYLEGKSHHRQQGIEAKLEKRNSHDTAFIEAGWQTLLDSGRVRCNRPP